MSSKFEWDAAKSFVCRETRGFDFDYASYAFEDPDQVVLPDLREDYGELRFKLLGEIDGTLHAVIYTPREGRTRIISARKASRNEVRIYENCDRHSRPK